MKRYEEILAFVMRHTEDDDIHEFLHRVLQGKENEGPSYRLKLNQDDLEARKRYESFLKSVIWSGEQLKREQTFEWFVEMENKTNGISSTNGGNGY